MTDETIRDDEPAGRFWYLIDAAVSDSLTDDQLRELEAMLKADPQLQQTYLEYARLNYELKFLHRAQRAVEGLKLGSQESGGRGQVSGVRGQGEKQRTRWPAARVLRSIAALAAVVLVALGVMTYLFWGHGTNVQPPIAKTTSAAVVAKLVRTDNANWDAEFAPSGKDLTLGQRLKLKTGTAEITFETQARVILEGPAELVLGGQRAEGNGQKSEQAAQSTIHNSCFLAVGKLTARVPEGAKGFTVDTPSGRATDLGTVFGVVVKTPAQTSPAAAGPPASSLKSPASTEVHVFQGEVEVSRVAEGGSPMLDSQKSGQSLSEILKTGQAVAMSLTGLTRLPAADPFQFRTEQLDGGPRHTIVSEDFESMLLGASGRILGDWRAEYATSKDQQITSVNPTTTFAGATGVPPVLPPVDQRTMEITSKAKAFGKQGQHLHPILTRDVDGRKFPLRCKLLVECDILPRTQVIEPSLGLNSDYPLRLAPGIALSREADPAAPKIEWRKDQWYRLRVVWDMEEGVPRGATVERLVWHGQEGWVRDVSVQLPAPKLATGPLAQVRFGFPAPIVGKAGGTFWLDNVRIELIAEK